ncbi:ATP dependent DNA ligase [Abortiporus biennis]|nr:ATP dependent DNA ligase [Abortiporus biennis]
MDVEIYRACIALLGAEIDAVADRMRHDVADFECAPSSNPYHITMFSKDETRALQSNHSSQELLQKVRESARTSLHLVHYLGVGRHPLSQPNVFFVVCIWAKGQQIRKHFGLPPKDFHITLSRSDTHNVDKGVSTVFSNQFPLNLSQELLDDLIFTLHMMGRDIQAKEYALLLCQQHPGCEKGFIRLGGIALKSGEYKLAMLSFAHGHQHSCSVSVKDYCIRKILYCAAETEWGTVFTTEEQDQLPRPLLYTLLEPWSEELRSTLSKVQFTPTQTRGPRDQMFIPLNNLVGNPHTPFSKLPRFFRWIVPFFLAVMSTPRDAVDLDRLSSPSIGIRHVLTLSEETPLKESWFTARRDIRNTYLPIPNYHPPTVEQMDLIIRLIWDSDNSPLLIHCGGGKGRAGTVIACYLVAFGFSRPPQDLATVKQPSMSAQDAISALRLIRPGSIETPQQESFVSQWFSTIWKRQSILPPVIPEPPPCHMEIEGVLHPDANLFIPVGLPGSGKSQLARSLLARNLCGWTWVCQDDAGSRTTCENQIGRRSTPANMILDRCNTSKSDREHWLSLAAVWSSHPTCVWFDYDRDLCASRAQSRANHPTLPPGSRVRKATEQMDKIFDKPSLDEGFSAIVTIRSFSASDELVERLSPSITLLKFPRTEHLIDLGAATSDDLISPHALSFLSSRPGSRVVITEKVDGANMGFSLSSDRTQILIQNRSHYVNSATHDQFKKLGLWVDSHRQDLYGILDRDPYFAQRYILYGEWMAATHSVSYNALPDWFLAFDLFDRGTQSFVDRERLEKLVEGTGIHLVPLLRHYDTGDMVTEEELKEMIQQKSNLTDGRLEGVYVKVEGGGKVLTRGKVVRGDFIAGNEHWTRGMINWNELKHV